jgi:hypothetical protein
MLMLMPQSFVRHVLWGSMLKKQDRRNVQTVWVESIPELHHQRALTAPLACTPLQRLALVCGVRRERYLK